MLKRGAQLLAAVLVAALCASFDHGAQPNQNVLTHLYNAQRTGWNQNEFVLNTTNVPAHFGVVCSVTTLDARIDTQPLIVRNLIVGGVARDVVYVATENDTVYELDATTCATITSVSLGTAVTNNGTVGCGNDNSTIGVLSTPAIDLATNTMYVIAYTTESGNPVFRIHALDLATLADKVSSQVIAATVKLSDGTTNYSFNASVYRQRTALLIANGNIYAGFSSFCDHNNHTMRGWVLAWQEGTLSPVTPAQLTNSLASDPLNPGSPIYLTSVWMSGAGIAADASGNIYFATANSDSSGSPGTGTTSFNPPENIQESVAKFNSSMSTLLDYFTDSNLISLDVNDNDMGSGGVLLLPDQPGPVTHLAFQGGKASTGFYLINRDNMGHWNNGGAPSVVATFANGGFCWCAPVYFFGSDGMPRLVVTAGSAPLIVPLNPNTDTFGTAVNTATMVGGGQDAGFFASVSSNANNRGTQILWAVSRPDTGVPPTLYAFDAISGATLYSHAAGQWTNLSGNANIVPVVSNGKVYVASDQQFYIFGLTS